MYSIEDFKTYQGSECLLSCVQNYFMNKGIHISECEIFIMGDGFHSTYRRIDQGNEFRYGIMSDVHSSSSRFCKCNNISLLMYKEVNDYLAEKRLVEKLSGGDSIIAKVDSGYLKYNPIYLNGFGLTHFINIIGFKSDSKVSSIYVCDGFIPTYPVSTYQGWQDYVIIKEGRKQKNNDYIEIDCSFFDQYAYNQKIKNGEMKYKLKDNLYEYLNGHKIGNQYFGILALKEFNKDFVHFIDYYGENYTEKMIQLNYDMKIHGLITSRMLLYKVLAEVNRFDNGEWNLEEEEMKSINRKWDNISLKIVKVGMSKQQKHLQILSGQLEEIILQEGKLFERIFKKLKL